MDKKKKLKLRRGTAMFNLNQNILKKENTKTTLPRTEVDKQIDAIMKKNPELMKRLAK